MKGWRNHISKMKNKAQIWGEMVIFWWGGVLTAVFGTGFIRELVGAAIGGTILMVVWFVGVALFIGLPVLLGAWGFILGVSLLIKPGVPPMVAWIVGMLLVSMMPALGFTLWNKLDGTEHSPKNDIETYR